MADQVVTTYSNATGYEAFRAVVFTTASIGYVIYRAGNLFYRKTTDGGSTWSGAITIEAGGGGLTAANACGIWYDRWTPGDDTGTKIHIVHGRAQADNNLRYISLDTNGDVVGPGSNIFSAVPISATQVVIGKARNGNLYVFGKWGTGSHIMRRSIDGGVTWTARAIFDSDFIDALSLEPGNEGDPADMWVFYSLINFEPTRLKMRAYDDSANTWSASTTVFNDLATSQIVDQRMRTVTRRSNNFVYMALVTGPGIGTNHVLRVFRIESLASVVALTNIVSGIFVSAVSITFDPINNHLYVMRVDLAGNLLYNRSTDLGATWDAAVQINSAGPYPATNGTQLSPILASGGRFYPMWANQDTSTARTLRANFTTSIVLAPPAPPSGLGGAGAAKALLDLF